MTGSDSKHQSVGLSPSEVASKHLEVLLSKKASSDNRIGRYLEAMTKVLAIAVAAVVGGNLWRRLGLPESKSEIPVKTPRLVI